MVKNKVEISLDFADYLFLGETLKQAAEDALSSAVHFADRYAVSDELGRRYFWESFHQYDNLQKLRGSFGFDTIRSYDDESLFKRCSEYLNACIDFDVNDREKNAND